MPTVGNVTISMTRRICVPFCLNTEIHIRPHAMITIDWPGGNIPPPSIPFVEVIININERKEYDKK